MSERKLCPDCDKTLLGQGFLDSHSFGNGECSRCHGTGKRRTIIEDIADGFGKPQDYELGYDACRECEGTGTCQSCGGDGFVVRHGNEADARNEDRREQSDDNSEIATRPHLDIESREDYSDDQWQTGFSSVNRTNPNIDKSKRMTTFVKCVKLSIALALAILGALVFLRSPGGNTPVSWRVAEWGLLRSRDGGRSWAQSLKTPTQVDAGLLATQGELILATSGYLSGADKHPQMFRSQDFGEHWTSNEIPIYVSVMLTGEDRTLLSGGSFGLYSSSDGGHTWSKVGKGAPQGILSLARDRKGVLYAGNDKGIFKSVDHGQRWHAMGLSHKSVRKLLLTAENRLFAGTNKGLFQSTDSGLSWALIGGGLPNQWVEALASGTDNELYSAASTGVYRSITGGRTWTRILSLGHSMVTYAIVAPARNRLFVSAGACCPVNPASLFYSDDGGKTWSRLLDVYNEKAVGMVATAENGDIFVALTWVGE